MPRLPATTRFAIRFLAIGTLLMVGFEASRGTFIERFLVVDCILKPTTALLRLFSPAHDVMLTDRVISSPASQLHVTRGCEGIEIFLILTAAVVAFPAPRRDRLRGLAAGFALAYALSVLRLAALHFTLRYASGAWEALHGVVLTLGPIGVAALYFMHWSGNLPSSRSSADRAHPT